MKVFKQVGLNGTYTNNSDKYQLLIHFNPQANIIQLLDENHNLIETYNLFFPILTTLQYPQISGQENLSTGAIVYNSFNVNIVNNESLFKNSFLKILIPPNFTVKGIQSGLFIELENLEELKGLL